MAFDSRFNGLWFDGEGYARIDSAPQGSDGRWYTSAGKTPYSFPDPASMICGHYHEDGTPFRWERVGNATSNSIIGQWRHEAEPDHIDEGDEGEDMTLRPDGTSLVRFDSEDTDYNGIFELSQDANFLYLMLFDDRFRLRTSAGTYALAMVDSGQIVSSGSFAFGVQPGSGMESVTMTDATDPASSLTLVRP